MTIPAAILRMPVEKLVDLGIKSTAVDLKPDKDSPEIQHSIIDVGVTGPYVEALHLQGQNDDVARLAAAARTTPTPPTGLQESPYLALGQGVSQRAALLTSAHLVQHPGLEGGLMLAGKAVGEIAYCYTQPKINGDMAIVLGQRPFVAALRDMQNPAAAIAMGMTGSVAAQVAASRAVFVTPHRPSDSPAVYVARAGVTAHQFLDQTDPKQVDLDLATVTRPYLDSIADARYGESPLTQNAALAAQVVEDVQEPGAKASVTYAALQLLRDAGGPLEPDGFLGLLGQKVLTHPATAQSIAASQAVATHLTRSDNPELAAIAELALGTSSPDPALLESPLRQVFLAAAPPAP